MSDTNMQDKLVQLTDGMLYISESDHELDVMDWGRTDKAGAIKKISAQAGIDAGDINEGDAATFFERTINALDPQDDFAAELAGQYKKLYAYLQDTFSEIHVFRAGEVQVHIFITCFTKEGDCFALHTMSVET